MKAKEFVLWIWILNTFMKNFLVTKADGDVSFSRLKFLSKCKRFLIPGKLDKFQWSSWNRRFCYVIFSNLWRNKTHLFVLRLVTSKRPCYKHWTIIDYFQDKQFQTVHLTVTVTNAIFSYSFFQLMMFPAMWLSWSLLYVVQQIQTGVLKYQRLSH